MTWRRAALAGAGLLAFVYAAASVDLALRSRSAYLEGEKWMDWAAHPEKKKAYFDARLAARERELDGQLASGSISQAERDKKLFLARFERDQAVAESSVKYAYVWFQSAAELFSPPETRWSAAARERMPKARELWKKELDAKKIPYQDWMLE